MFYSKIMEILTDILFIFILILLNGFFSGAEIAIISLKKFQIQKWLEEGDPRGKILFELRNKPDNFFATVQLGVTFLSILASVYGGSRLLDHLTPYLEQIELPFYLAVH